MLLAWMSRWKNYGLYSFMISSTMYLNMHIDNKKSCLKRNGSSTTTRCSALPHRPSRICSVMGSQICWLLPSRILGIAGILRPDDHDIDALGAYGAIVHHHGHLVHGTEQGGIEEGPVSASLSVHGHLLRTRRILWVALDVHHDDGFQLKFHDLAA